ncbi:CPCC family cysteine-rich protein [Yersinia rohdei]|uniref:CPCC family cysteine-rich protein n=1 Tax=Yersinia rohdei TaxID=29485 RepID=UPI0011A4DE83|nr:CPCC family cysteine-rich protein [Yersinia rohdei]
MSNEPEVYSCPCCGSPVIDELGCYEICPVCGWEDDPVQSSDPEYEGGANKMSLNSAKRAYRSLN